MNLTSLFLEEKIPFEPIRTGHKPKIDKRHNYLSHAFREEEVAILISQNSKSNQKDEN